MKINIEKAIEMINGGKIITYTDINRQKWIVTKDVLMQHLDCILDNRDRLESPSMTLAKTHNCTFRFESTDLHSRLGFCKKLGNVFITKTNTVYKITDCFHFMRNPFELELVTVITEITFDAMNIGQIFKFRNERFVKLNSDQAMDSKGNTLSFVENTKVRYNED